MKKIVTVAAIAALVVSVALTGCNGKKGESASTGTEVSENTKPASRKEINAYLKEFENIIKKIEKAAKKGDMAAINSLYEDAGKLEKKYGDPMYSSDWNDSDTMKLEGLALRFNNALSAYKPSR